MMTCPYMGLGGQEDLVREGMLFDAQEGGQVTQTPPLGLEPGPML